MTVTMFENNVRLAVISIDTHLALYMDGDKGSFTLFITHENKGHLATELRKAAALVEMRQPPAPPAPKIDEQERNELAYDAPSWPPRARRRQGALLMETQWFEWDGWSRVDDTVLQFSDVTMKVDLGLGIFAGDTFPVAVLDQGEKPTLTIQDNEGIIIAQFRIVCTLEPIV
jgi:hypothetical protein